MTFTQQSMQETFSISIPVLQLSKQTYTQRAPAGARGGGRTRTRLESIKDS